MENCARYMGPVTGQNSTCLRMPMCPGMRI
jgi:hypothetical protein